MTRKLSGREIGTWYACNTRMGRFFQLKDLETFEHFHRRAFLHFDDARVQTLNFRIEESSSSHTCPNRQDTHCETGDWEQHNRRDRHEHFLRQGDLIDFDSSPQNPASCGFILSDWRFTCKKWNRRCCEEGVLQCRAFSIWDPQQVRTKVYSTAVPKQLEAGKPWQIYKVFVRQCLVVTWRPHEMEGYMFFFFFDFVF